MYPPEWELLIFRGWGEMLKDDIADTYGKHLLSAHVEKNDKTNKYQNRLNQIDCYRGYFTN